MNLNTGKENKKCPKCGIVKNRSEFYRVKGQKVKVICSDCRVILKTCEEFTKEEIAYSKGEIKYLAPIICESLNIKCKKLLK